VRKYIIIGLGLLIGFTLFEASKSFAQEQTAPLYYNPIVNKAAKQNMVAAKTTATALTLPFFEDFTTYNIFPDPNKWTDHQVYINNTMCKNPVSRGVATFDALNQYGIPYDTLYNSSLIYGDSLTSFPIDLSSNTPADSIYFSFLYQPQGNGFVPLPKDSLMLWMLKKNGTWVNVWSVPGSSNQPFQMVMFPITDTEYLYAGFKFRFINKVSMGTSDNIWNLDYIKIDKNRNIGDTTINDVAFTKPPTFLLNDYTYMPYRQFNVNPSSELAATHTATITNNTFNTAPVNYGYTAKETTTNTPLFSSTVSSGVVSSFANLSVTFPTYSTSFTAGTYDKVVFENKYYMQPNVSVADANDTIVCEQVFDNYLAYDDGTAEKSYYLNLFSSLPGKMAVEYHLNQPDVLQGISIYFGRQVPSAWYKTFSIVVWSDIGVNGSGTETILRQEDDYTPGYIDTVNHFWNYRLQSPLNLPVGTFYMGIILPALSGSDSLYIGLDVNRIGSNHAYYNVNNYWQTSTIGGALMIRPLLGLPFTPSATVEDMKVRGETCTILPNPCTGYFSFAFTPDGKPATYTITDIQGKQIKQGQAMPNKQIDISELSNGMYFVILHQEGQPAISRKLVKQ